MSRNWDSIEERPCHLGVTVVEWGGVTKLSKEVPDFSSYTVLHGVSNKRIYCVYLGWTRTKGYLPLVVFPWGLSLLPFALLS